MMMVCQITAIDLAFVIYGTGGLYSAITFVVFSYFPVLLDMRIQK